MERYPKPYLTNDRVCGYCGVRFRQQFGGYSIDILDTIVGPVSLMRPIEARFDCTTAKKNYESANDRKVKNDGRYYRSVPDLVGPQLRDDGTLKTLLQHLISSAARIGFMYQVLLTDLITVRQVEIPISIILLKLLWVRAAKTTTVEYIAKTC
ncbi:hypothetical protein BDP27DRAFT_1368015 [Rhodocollybia butyracea]|uniref:Uncharacterized protein n=1 Tax=Rhodocollybia butyracea TaxID=206335 RepID=A0A9P5PDY7_9AGAR|nr:hypothetical protein BDP27DRAFT_1368015 [Rhodocollybia butyracea]